MNSLLKRQLKKLLGHVDPIPPEWQRFVEGVGQAYDQFDDDRNMLERSLDLSSAELVAANSQLQAILDTFPDLFFLTDADGRILEQKNSGKNADYSFVQNPVGVLIQDVHSSAAHTRFQQAISQVRERREPVSIEYAVRIRETLEHYEARLLPLRGDKIIIIIRNISVRKTAEEVIRKAQAQLEEKVAERTAELRAANESLQREIAVRQQIAEERKRAEQEIRSLNAELEQRVVDRTRKLEAANKELEAFGYSVSHDLRAPLRSIDGFSRLLQDDYAEKLDAEGRMSLEKIRGSARRMTQLIDDMLQLSRVDGTEFHRRPVNLSALARDVCEEFRKSDPQRVVELVIEPALGAQADEQLIRIVLENLLGNAWKFTGCQPAARIEFGRADCEKAYFVRDNGAGFDSRFVGKLFQAFQRLHTAREFPGTGIGLATVQRVIQRHGGRVWAEGECGRGATFYFTLPDEGDFK